MDDIKRKILGLMAKTTDNGCSEHEAMAAAALVQKLLNQYQLSLSDIKLKEQANCVKGKYDYKVRKHGALYWVISGIGYFTDTTCWYDERGGDDGLIAYKYFGFEHDVIIAEYITKLCDWAIIYDGEDYKRSAFYDAQPKGARRAKCLLDFRIGMANRLNKRLRDMKDEVNRQNATDGRSLVVVKGAIVKEEAIKAGLVFGRGGGQKQSIVYADAYHAGGAAGDKVQINPGVNHTRGSAQLERT